MRRAHDAIAEIQRFGTHGYRWVLDADIEAAFDNLSRSALLGRVRARVKDKRVLALVKAFLKARIRTLTSRTSQQPPRDALIRLNQIMRGWANYFKHAACKHTMKSLENFTWHRGLSAGGRDCTAGSGKTSAVASPGLMAGGSGRRRAGSS